MPETPDERLARVRFEMQQRADLFKKLVDEFGPRVLDVVGQQLADNAQAQFERLPLPRRDLHAVMSVLWEQVGDDLAYTVEEQTPEHLKMKVTRCIWADEMRKLDAPDVGYAFYCSWDFGFCRGLNPAMTFTRTQTLMQGADSCDHTYDLKASGEE
jgi:hypothetical protein